MCPTNARPIDVPLRVRRDAPSPIAAQIADQIVTLIRAGHLRGGNRLPPVRMLAGFLRVNRNTVAKVYSSLERSGFLVTTPGRGTFVTTVVPPGPSDTLVPLADRLIDEAAAHGISEGELRALVAERAALRQQVERPRVGFVECNGSDLAYFTRQLTSRLRVPLIPVLLHDLRRAAKSLDLIATTMFHVEEVRRLARRHEVIGLLALPEFQTLDAVAQLPADSRIALICATREGVRSKERSIRAAGIRRPHMMAATIQQRARLRAVLQRADVVLASPKVLERIQDQIPERARVIPFASVLGEGALALLDERIRVWRPSTTLPSTPRQSSGQAPLGAGRKGTTSGSSGARAMAKNGRRGRLKRRK